jgi:hypothetical protein
LANAGGEGPEGRAAGVSQHVRVLSGVPLRVASAQACDLVEEDPWGMLTEEDDVEVHALKARGWTVAAIARHTGGGRDRAACRP